MKTINKLIRFLLILPIVLIVSCEVGNLDLQDDPNNITIIQARANFLLNEVQLDFNNAISGYNATTLGVVRMDNQFGTYANAVDNLTLNGEWANTYQIRANTKLIGDLAAGNPAFTNHYAIARLLEAYAMVTLVDFVGDVPYEEANNPSQFPNPGVSLGEDIYDFMFVLIDEAIADLDANNSEPFNDLFYNEDVSKWRKFGNSLKYKMFLNLRLIDAPRAAQGISNLNAVISSESDSFEFQYSSSTTPADSRSPLFVDGYSPGGASTYMSNSFMNELLNGKSNRDPRLRYYIYRQTSNDPDQANNGELPCLGNPDYDFCYLGDAYWGRDHTDDEGIPADGTFRATYGIYPGGGTFDNDAFIQGSDNTGIEGAGIQPILSYSYMKFMEAEAALTINGVSGNPQALLEEGIRASMEKVLNFATVDPAFAASAIDVNTYVTEVLTEYTNAASDDERLNIIMTEYYLAAFGYSIEAYNGYRRTGFPDSSIMQIPIFTSTGFPRNYRYPRSAVTANTSIDENTVFEKVFWDTNPDNFIQ